MLSKNWGNNAFYLFNKKLLVMLAVVLFFLPTAAKACNAAQNLYNFTFGGNSYGQITSLASSELNLPSGFDITSDPNIDLCSLPDAAIQHILGVLQVLHTGRTIFSGNTDPDDIFFKQLQTDEAEAPDPNNLLKPDNWLGIVLHATGDYFGHAAGDLSGMYDIPDELMQAVDFIGFFEQMSALPRHTILQQYVSNRESMDYKTAWDTTYEEETPLHTLDPGSYTLSCNGLNWDSEQGGSILPEEGYLECLNQNGGQSAIDAFHNYAESIYQAYETSKSSAAMNELYAEIKTTLEQGTVVTPVTLQSIAITTPASKLSYTIGDVLDLTGLVVIGTYSDSSTSTEPIAITDVTGFNSSAPATGQTLTITFDGQTTTYTVNIVAASTSSNDATLSSLTVSTGTLNPTFSPTQTSYSVVLPTGATVVPIVVATTNDSNATSNIAQAASLPGSATVAVMAQDGTTKQTYTINFTVINVASTGTWTILDAPGATYTRALGIDGKNIVGYYTDSSGWHGFIYNGATWTTLDMPGARWTQALGISGNNIVGVYGGTSEDQSFLYNITTGIWSTLNMPGTLQTFVSGIDGNNIVGWADVNGNGDQSFLYNGTIWTTIEGCPTVSGISGNNMVGGCGLYNGTTWTALNMPGATYTSLSGISGNSIIGSYYNGSPLPPPNVQLNHGFLYGGKTWTTFDAPGAAVISTIASGISGNNIVGSYTDASENTHGFLYTISGSSLIPVTSITVTGAGSATSVVSGQTLQMSATVLPSDANQTATWSVTNGTGIATIDQTGLLTAETAGTVTVKATANDGSGVTGTETITVQPVPLDYAILYSQLDKSVGLACPINSYIHICSSPNYQDLGNGLSGIVRKITISMAINTDAISGFAPYLYDVNADTSYYGENLQFSKETMAYIQRDYTFDFGRPIPLDPTHQYQIRFSDGSFNGDGFQIFGSANSDSYPNGEWKTDSAVKDAYFIFEAAKSQVLPEAPSEQTFVDNVVNFTGSYDNLNNSDKIRFVVTELNSKTTIIKDFDIPQSSNSIAVPYDLNVSLTNGNYQYYVFLYNSNTKESSDYSDVFNFQITNRPQNASVFQLYKGTAVNCPVNSYSSDSCIHPPLPLQDLGYNLSGQVDSIIINGRFDVEASEVDYFAATLHDLTTGIDYTTNNIIPESFVQKDYIFKLNPPVILDPSHQYRIQINLGSFSGGGLVIFGSDNPNSYNAGSWGDNQPSDEKLKDIYFILTTTTLVQPPVLSGLGQFQTNGTTPIGEDSTTKENAVMFQGTPTSPVGNQVQLQVEVQPSGIAFTGIPTATSSFVTSGQIASATVFNLTDGQYHWQARATDSQGNSSAWQTMSNPAVNPDFTIAPAPVKQDQTITVGTPAPSDETYNTSFTVAASASSNLTVAVSVDGGVCTISGNTVTMTSGIGTCLVKFDQGGNDSFNEAPTISENVTADKASQVITVNTSAPKNAVFNTNFTVAADASSGLPVTYSTSGVCTNSGAIVSMNSGTGKCAVNYNQAGSDNFAVADQVIETVNATPKVQTIDVITPAPASAVYGSSFTVVATADSGLGVTYSSAGGCSNVGPVFTMTSGTTACTVKYDQAGDTNYASATEVIETAVARLKVQTITVTTPAPASATYGQTFNVAANSDSSLPVVITVSGICSINSNGAVTMTNGTGTCTVKYDQPGDGNYAAAVEQTNTTTAQKAGQTITINSPAPPSAGYNTSFTVAATASSGQPVAINVSSNAGTVCTISGSTVTMAVSSGICKVTFTQSGNNNFNAATPITENIIATKASQTITVNKHAPLTASRNSSFSVSAAASSKLGVSITTTGNCNGNGSNSATITMGSGSGGCTIHYNQTGNTNYTAAPGIADTTTILKSDQVITVTNVVLATATYNSTFVASATSNSGLAVAIAASGSCSGSGSRTATIRMTSGSGTCSVTYSQAGNAIYNAAISVVKTTSAQPAGQTITITRHAPNSAKRGTSFTVAATASSRLAVAIVATGNCTGSGNGSATITMGTATTGTTSCAVSFRQAGNTNYSAATPVSEITTAR